MTLPRGAALIDWLAEHPPRERDRAVEQLFGIAGPFDGAPPGPDLVGYVPSGIAPIVRMVLDVPIGVDDTLVVLGAGLGKVLQAVHLLTGARVRGVEIQPALCAAARVAAGDLPIVIEEGDLRTAAVSDATLVYMYAPFSGPVVTEVAARLEDKRVCTLGLDLPGRRARPTSHFWLSIYDVPQPPSTAVPLGPRAEAVADER